MVILVRSIITFGKQFDDSRFDFNLTTSGKTGTEIEVGDQHGRSVRNVHITDMDQLAADLASMRKAANSKDEAQGRLLKQAEEAAKVGDQNAVWGFLKKAGSWGLELAVKVGAEVAQTAIKKSLGL